MALSVRLLHVSSDPSNKLTGTFQEALVLCSHGKALKQKIHANQKNPTMSEKPGHVLIQSCLVKNSRSLTSQQALVKVPSCLIYYLLADIILFSQIQFEYKIDISGVVSLLNQYSTQLSTVTRPLITALGMFAFGNYVTLYLCVSNIVVVVSSVVLTNFVIMLQYIF